MIYVTKVGYCVAIAVAMCATGWGAAPSDLVFSALLTGSQGVDLKATTADAQGNIYVVGSTNSADFPVTPGALQTKIGPNGDAFVCKFSPAGVLLWSTFYGGTYGASANAVAVDSAGNVVVAGDTYSPDFPVVNAYQPVFNNGITQPKGQADAFVFKLDSTGTKVVYSTFLGSYTSGVSLALDRTGAAYATGILNAFDPQPFPSFTNFSGKSGTYVAKLDSAGKFSYAYYYPFYPDATPPAGIAVDNAGSAYVASYSTDSQGTMLIFKLSPDGSRQIYQTAIGQGIPTALAVDSAGSAHLTGWTSNIGFPLVNALETSFGARPLWKSTNGGVTWNPSEDPPFTGVLGLAVTPGNSEALYAATSQGLFQSTDGGVSWSASGSGIASGAVGAVAVNPANPRMLYAGTFLGDTNLGTGAVYQSRDGGSTWTAVDSGLAGVMQLAIDPQNPLNVYSVLGTGDVRKSADGGATWSTVQKGITNIALDPHASGSVWAYIPAGHGFPIGFLGATSRPALAGPTAMLLHSADGGATWTQIPSVQPTGPGVVVDGSANPSTIYAGLAARSTDGGTTWQPLSLLVNGLNGGTALATDSSGLLFAAQGCPMFSSGNKGQTWSAIGSPDPVTNGSGDCPLALGLYPAGPGTLYARMARAQVNAFVTKLSPDGSSIVYSTYLRGHESMLPIPSGTAFGSQNAATAIAVDPVGNIAVAGWTRTADFPVVNAAQSSNAGGADAFVAMIAPSGAWLNYSTYLGGSQEDGATALALDPQGNLIVAGQTISGDFPGASGPVPAQPIGFVAKLSIPPPSISAVLSAASFQPAIGSGSWVMIKGSNLANTTRVWQSSDFSGNNLPIALDGLSVTIDGIPAYVEYISPSQINVQAPDDSATGAAT